MAARWMCGSGLQPVRVVHGDGQLLSLLPPVKVADVLISHPHHYICHMSPELPSNKSPMLSLDYDLEPGYLYFLLPLPRLFPTSSAGPPSCCCRVSNLDTSLEEGHTTPTSGRDSSGGGHQRFGFSPLRLRAVQQVMDRIGSPIRTAKKKVSPELSRSPANGKLETASPLLSPSYGPSKHSKRSSGLETFDRRRKSPSRRCKSPSRSFASRFRESNGDSRDSQAGTGRCFMEDFLCSKWKPRLGCISETDAVVSASEAKVCLDRRRLTFDAKLPRSNSSPVRLGDILKSPSRERLLKSPTDDGYYTDRPMRHMSLASYIFV